MNPKFQTLNITVIIFISFNILLDNKIVVDGELMEFSLKEGEISEPLIINVGEGEQAGIHTKFEPVTGFLVSSFSLFDGIPFAEKDINGTRKDLLSNLSTCSDLVTSPEGATGELNVVFLARDCFGEETCDFSAELYTRSKTLFPQTPCFAGNIVTIVFIFVGVLCIFGSCFLVFSIQLKRVKKYQKK